jgi:hypothetical protein
MHNVASSKAVIPAKQAGIQYVAASRFYLHALEYWIIRFCG